MNISPSNGFGSAQVGQSLSAPRWSGLQRVLVRLVGVVCWSLLAWPLQPSSAGEQPPTLSAAATSDPLARQLETVIARHGWPCEAVSGYVPGNEGRFEVTCSEGRTYQIYLHDEWDWRTTKRQTALHELFDVSERVALLQSADPIVRERAAAALADVGPAAGAAIPALTRALDDPDERVRRSAARALAAIRSN